MDILDIAIAKKMASKTAEPVLEQAKEALNTANQANVRAQEAEDSYDNLLAVTDQSMLVDFSDEIESLSISNVILTEENTDDSKNKKLTVTKEKIDTDYTVNKNYTSMGENEDGGMTQKAITEAINQLEQELIALKILLGVE